MSEPWSPLRDSRATILIALMVVNALIAMDSTVLATAVPSITQELGSFEQFPWLFSVYLLGQAVTVPVYGKLADMYGRKPVLVFGVLVFLVSSLLAGFAPNMLTLIVARGAQGIGAGAISSMAMTIPSDIYSLDQRGKIQGYIASVWAICSVLGPSIGGVLATLDAWRWIFFINVPLGLLSLWLLRTFREDLDRIKHRVDVLGAAVLTIALTALVLGTLEGGSSWPWLSWQTAVIYGLGVVLLVLLVPIERRAAEPIITPSLLTGRLILASLAVTFTLGMLVTGITSFGPTYLQVSLTLSPIFAGLAVAAMTLSWPIASGFSSRLYLRRGFRSTLLLGSAIALLGTVMLAITSHWPNALVFAACTLLMGVGLGLTSAPNIIAAQNSVNWERRGSVTAMLTLSRSTGSALGVAVFGALLNAVTVNSENTRVAAVVDGTQLVFIGAAVTAALMLLAASGFLPDRPDGDVSSSQ